MRKKFSARSTLRQTIKPSIFVLPILLAVLAVGCGESPGGSQYGGDTTPPVTSANKDTGNYDAETVIIYTCTDNSSGCDKYYLSTGLAIDDPEYTEYDWEIIRESISGAGSNSFTIQLCGASFSGKTYDYSFYSTDKVGNQESAQSRLYTVN